MADPGASTQLDLRDLLELFVANIKIVLGIALGFFLLGGMFTADCCPDLHG